MPVGRELGVEVNCPIKRGGCGARLEWDDGAFCKSCMAAAQEKLRIKEKEAAEKREEWK